MSKLRNIAPIDLFIFDMDGVIFEEKNFWFDLHKAYGSGYEALNYFQKDQIAEEKYAITFKEMAQKFWKGIHTHKFSQIVEARSYTPGIFEVFNYLHQTNIPTAIISSGPLELAQRAQKDLHIDYIYANSLEMEANHFTGLGKVQVDDYDKMLVAHELLQHLSISPEKVAFIGDSERDHKIAQEVGLSIAYNTDSELLLNSSDIHLKKGELIKVKEIIQKRFSSL